jgi:hypothetical protein
MGRGCGGWVPSGVGDGRLAPRACVAFPSGWAMCPGRLGATGHGGYEERAWGRGTTSLLDVGAG